MKSCCLSLLVATLLLVLFAMFLWSWTDEDVLPEAPTAEEAAAAALAALPPPPPTPKEKAEALTGLELVLIPAGSFLMGSLPSEKGHDRDEAPQHEVHITQPFWMSKYEVTNGQYLQFRDTMGNPYPQYWSYDRYNGPHQPVVGVSWDDAVAFCDWAGMVLPTEAQWEYAARAGTTTRFWSGDTEEDLARVAWSDLNRLEGGAHPVGEKPANAFGLHDIHGNVWEWTADWYGRYKAEAQTDPTGPSKGDFRLYRGGSWANWHDRARDSRSADRYWLSPEAFSEDLGFRPILPIPPGEEPAEVEAPGAGSQSPPGSEADPGEKPSEAPATEVDKAPAKEAAAQ